MVDSSVIKANIEQLQKRSEPRVVMVYGKVIEANNKHP